MQRYGAIARDHWKKWLPKRYSQLEDPDSYFSELGEQIEERVNELSQALAGDDPPGEQYLEKVGRLRMARTDAESQALQEMALIEPETP
jgi:hypothetical protein